MTGADSLGLADLPDSPASVVVLEDDPTNAALLRQVLIGMNVTNPLEFFTNGREAADHLEEVADSARAPVLVILDLSVPDLSGLDVLARIRARTELAAVPVVMLSGSGDDDDIERAYQIGIDAYLVKPAGIHGLPDVITGLGLPFLLLPRAR